MVSRRETLIVADDVTGAADAAAAFARPGAAAEVRFWDAIDEPMEAEVVAVTTESRDLDVQTSGERLERVLDRVSGRQLFIKIDSLLRGHVREVLAAITARTDRPIVLAPAHPRQGRQTHSGSQCVDGRPDPLVDLRDLVPPGVTSIVYGKADPAVAQALMPGQVLIVDAAEHAELEELAVRIQGSDPSPVLVGSAGLAAAMGSMRELSAPPDQEEALSRERLLVIVGSASPTARRQADAAGAQLGAQRVTLGADDLSGDRTQLSERLRDLLLKGPVIVDLAPPVDGSPLDLGWAQTLAEITAPLVDASTATVLVGGATAAAVLRHHGVSRLRVQGELDDGVPIMFDPSGGITVITKAGEFGDAHVLSTIASKHMLLRQKGNLT